jgi:hypothetical protein
MSVLRGGGGVDLLEHAQAAGVLVLQAGLLGAAGGAEGAEEFGGARGVVGPDVAVAGVMGGLRAAGGVAQPGQWLVRVRGSGQPQAQRLGRLGEPALWRPGSYAA